MTGKEIAKKIYDYEAPMYVMYDFVSVKGMAGKISSSKGNALTLDEVEEVYEPEILRYLFVGTRPSKGFEISFDNDVIKIYDDYDELERKYYSGEADEQEKKIYEFSRLKVGKKKPEKISFRHLVTLVQTGKTKNLNGANKIRAEKVANWIEKYAGDDMRFKIQDDIEISLTENEKKALKILREKLKERNYNEDELLNEFYGIVQQVGIQPKDFFGAAYGAIIGKTKGPRLAALILAAKEKIIKLLGKIK
jgi:lysyl-tRNA synthetase, class I